VSVFHRWAAGLLFALGASGCGTSAATYPVDGTVVFDDGKPAHELAGGSVSFESATDQSNASGEIQTDATFRARTQKGEPGMRPGRYRVLVMPPPPEDEDKRPPALIDPRLSSYETSGISVEIEAKPNRTEIKLPRRR
jgi:hypothetical protein